MAGMVLEVSSRQILALGALVEMSQEEWVKRVGLVQIREFFCGFYLFEQLGVYSGTCSQVIKPAQYIRRYSISICTYQIWIDRGVMSHRTARESFSSLEGNAVRAYTSFKILSCLASVLFRFFLITVIACVSINEVVVQSILSPTESGGLTGESIDRCDEL